MKGLKPMGYTIKDIPNTEPYVNMARTLRDPGLFFRLRGRGVPKGEPWRRYQFGTPLSVAPRCAVYAGSWPYLRYAFAGMDESKGKMRIRPV